MKTITNNTTSNIGIVAISPNGQVTVIRTLEPGRSHDVSVPAGYRVPVEKNGYLL